MTATYTVSVKVSYVEMYDKEKKKMVSVPVFHRKMYIRDTAAIFDSGDYRVNCRGGKRSPAVYTLAAIPRIAQSCWSNPSGKTEVWYKLKPDWRDSETNEIVRPFERTDDKPWNEEQFLRWLTFRLGAQGAKDALRAMMAEPAKKQAA